MAKDQEVKTIENKEGNVRIVIQKYFGEREHFLIETVLKDKSEVEGFVNTVFDKTLTPRATAYAEECAEFDRITAEAELEAEERHNKKNKR